MNHCRIAWITWCVFKIIHVQNETIYIFRQIDYNSLKLNLSVVIYLRKQTDKRVYKYIQMSSIYQKNIIYTYHSCTFIYNA